MSRPRPQSWSGGKKRHSDEIALLELMAAMAALWGVGWVVLTIAGAAPRGGLPSALHRVGTSLGPVLAGHSGTGGWLHILWNPSSPPSLRSVILVSGGLALLAAVLVHLGRRAVGHVPGLRSRSQATSSGASPVGSATGGGQSLDEWLAAQAAGEDE